MCIYFLNFRIATGFLNDITNFNCSKYSYKQYTVKTAGQGNDLMSLMYIINELFLKKLLNAMLKIFLQEKIRGFIGFLMLVNELNL